MKTVKGGLPIRRGQVWGFQITLKRKDSKPDATGKTVRMDFKDRPADSASRFTLLSSGDLTVEQTADAIIFAGTLTGAQTLTIPETVQKLSFDMATQESEGWLRLFGGTVDVKWGVVRS